MQGAFQPPAPSARAVCVRTRPQRVLGSFSSGLNADRPVIQLKPTDGKMTVPQLPIADFGIFAPLAVQIMRQLVDGELMITNNIFDQIADRDDSHQLSLVNDGKVANSLVGHHRHAFFGS